MCRRASSDGNAFTVEMSDSASHGGTVGDNGWSQVATATHTVPPWLVVRWGEGLKRRTPVHVLLGRGKRALPVTVSPLADVTGVVSYWEAALVLGVRLFGVRMDMVKFNSLLGVLGTVVPALLTRVAASWAP